MKRVIFATEIPSLLQLDIFHSHQTTLEKIAKRNYQETKLIYQKIKIGSDTEQARVEFRSVNQKVEGEIKIFQRELTPTIIVSGRCEVQDHAITMRKKRKKLYRGLFEDEMCLAQIYLWLVNDRQTCVVFIEYTDLGTQHITIIRETPEFIWKEKIAIMVEEFLLTRKYEAKLETKWQRKYGSLETTFQQLNISPTPCITVRSENNSTTNLPSPSFVPPSP
jgi:hypothetical protein